MEMNKLEEVALSSYCFSPPLLLLCGEIIRFGWVTINLLVQNTLKRIISILGLVYRGEVCLYTQKNIWLTTVSRLIVIVLQNHVFHIFLLSSPLVSRSSYCNFHLSCSPVNNFLYLRKLTQVNTLNMLVAQG